MKDPRIEDSTMKEVRRRVRQHQGEHVSGLEADCMYWLKHHEVGFIIAALGHEKERDAYDSRTQKIFALIQRKIAKQWIKYDRAEQKRREAA